MTRCAWCRRRDVTIAAGVLSRHSPVDTELIFPAGEQCPGSATEPVARLSETVDWARLMGVPSLATMTAGSYPTSGGESDA